MNKKLKRYAIFIVAILIIIFLFPPVKESGRSNGYSFIFNIDNFESIDTTRTFFQCFLTILLAYMAYLVNDKIYSSSKLLLNKLYISRKIKITFLLLVIFISIAFLWGKYSENVLDVFLYSKSDFRDFFVDLDADQKIALDLIKSNSNDENFKVYDSIVNHLAEDESQLINSLKAPIFLSKPIIEKYLIDKKSSDWAKMQKGEVDWGGVAFALTCDIYNIEYEIPKVKSIKMQSWEDIEKEIYNAKSAYYNVAILETKKIRDDYFIKKTKCTQFASIAETFNLIGLFLILMMLISTIIIYYRKSYKLKGKALFSIGEFLLLQSLFGL